MNRLPGLDLLRAIAIIWVMLFHSAIAGMGIPVREFSVFGWMGVDLFFVLSGFLIGSQLFKSIDHNNNIRIRQFYISRAFRILPAFLVVTALYFLIPFTREGNGLPPLWQFLTFSVNLLVDVNTNTFSHVWSLCIEEHFYLLLPLFALGFMKIGSTAKISVVLIAIAAFGMWLRSDIWLNDLTGYPVYRDYVEKIYYPSYTRLDGLLAGVLLALLKVFKPTCWSEITHHGNKVFFAGVAGLALTVWLFQDRFGYIATVYGFPLLSLSLAFIVAAASSTQSLIGKFKIPGAGLIATLAYSLYLTHKSVYYMVKENIVWQYGIYGLTGFVITTAAVFIVAAMLYLLVERPFLKLRALYLSKD